MCLGLFFRIRSGCLGGLCGFGLEALQFLLLGCKSFFDFGSGFGLRVRSLLRLDPRRRFGFGFRLGPGSRLRLIPGVLLGLSLRPGLGIQLLLSLRRGSRDCLLGLSLYLFSLLGFSLEPLVELCSCLSLVIGLLQGLCPSRRFGFRFGLGFGSRLGLGLDLLVGLGPGLGFGPQPGLQFRSRLGLVLSLSFGFGSFFSLRLEPALDFFQRRRVRFGLVLDFGIQPGQPLGFGGESLLDLGPFFRLPPGHVFRLFFVAGLGLGSGFGLRSLPRLSLEPFLGPGQRFAIVFDLLQSFFDRLSLRLGSLLGLAIALRLGLKPLLKSQSRLGFRLEPVLSIFDRRGIRLSFLPGLCSDGGEGFIGFGLDSGSFLGFGP